jgi:hypothetical protein
MFRKRIRCTDSRMRRIAKEVIHGTLGILPNEKESQDLHDFNKHTEYCLVCRAAVLERAHEVITVPTLVEIANKNKEPLEVVVARFAAQAKKFLANGCSNLTPFEKALFAEMKARAALHDAEEVLKAEAAKLQKHKE